MLASTHMVFLVVFVVQIEGDAPHAGSPGVFGLDSHDHHPKLRNRQIHVADPNRMLEDQVLLSGALLRQGSHDFHGFSRNSHCQGT